MLAATSDFTINLFAYAACNPIINVDPEGTCPYNGTAADFRRLERELPSMNCTCWKSYINHINRNHYTTPQMMLIDDILLGKLGFSLTSTYQNCDSYVAYSFCDIGNDASFIGVGLNIYDLIGLEIGGSTEIHVFIKFQITPWVHAEASLGLDGVGFVLGTDNDNISSDFEIKGGWGLFGLLFFPYVFFGTQTYPVTQPA